MRAFVFSLVIPLLVLTGCHNPTLDAAQQQAMANFRPKLPLPYQEGMKVESIHRHGKDLVLVIRFNETTVAQAQANRRSQLYDLKTSEEIRMVQLCQTADFIPLLTEGGGLRRRFIDANDAVFFEVSLSADRCALTPAPETPTPSTQDAP